MHILIQNKTYTYLTTATATCNCACEWILFENLTSVNVYRSWESYFVFCVAGLCCGAEKSDWPHLSFPYLAYLWGGNQEVTRPTPGGNHHPSLLIHQTGPCGSRVSPDSSRTTLLYLNGFYLHPRQDVAAKLFSCISTCPKIRYTFWSSSSMENVLMGVKSSFLTTYIFPAEVSSRKQRGQAASVLLNSVRTNWKVFPNCHGYFHHLTLLGWRIIPHSPPSAWQQLARVNV